MIELEQPERCNCVVWAWRMFRRYGGVLLFRQSRYMRWLFHVAWAPKVGATADETLGYTARQHLHIPQVPWFKGHVTTEGQELREYLSYWTKEDSDILRARAMKGSDQMADVRDGMKVYSDYIATLNL
jgi:hypothetical protein